MMRLCPASCLGLGIPDNSSSHSCQLWAQRDECAKNAAFMKDACASTCSEHLFREQTKLRLARNTLGGAKHAMDALAAAGLLDEAPLTVSGASVGANVGAVRSRDADVIAQQLLADHVG